MTEDTTQAVVDTPNAEPAVQSTEANAQGDDLNTLLAEFEKGTQPQPQPVQTQQQQPDPNKEVLDEIKTFRMERAQEKHAQDLAKLVQGVKGELDVPDWMVEGFIDAQARKSKAIQNLWANRDSHPTEIKRLEASFKKEFARSQNAPKVDANATVDKAAMTAAVRGASTKTPETAPPKLGAMNNHEYNQFLRENGLAKGVV